MISFSWIFVSGESWQDDFNQNQKYAEIIKPTFYSDVECNGEIYFVLLNLSSVCPYIIIIILLQVKYKEDGKKEMSINLYSLLPETIDTQHAKEVSNLQSEVFKVTLFFFLLLILWIEMLSLSLMVMNLSQVRKIFHWIILSLNR